MQIRKATMNDLPDILAIYAYARKYMKEHGNPDQWRDSYPPVSLTKQDIQKKMSKSEAYSIFTGKKTLITRQLTVPG